MSQLLRARPRLFLVVGVVLALVLVSATSVLATTWASSAGKVQKLKVVTADNYVYYSSGTSWTDIPGMSLTLSVPTGKAIFLVTFSGANSCADVSGNGGGCFVRVRVNGQTMQPGEVLFDYGPLDQDYSGGAHSMQFLSDPLPAGSYAFTAQWRVAAATTLFQIEHRTMSVLRAKL